MLSSLLAGLVCLRVPGPRDLSIAPISPEFPAQETRYVIGHPTLGSSCDIERKLRTGIQVVPFQGKQPS